MFVDDIINQTQRQLPEITFSSKDHKGIIPHVEDPMVIPLHMFNCDVKRTFVDPGSSCDMLYYDAFKKLILDPE